MSSGTLGVLIFLASVLVASTALLAQASPLPTDTPSTPSPAPVASTHPMVTLRFPKGWSRCQGDSVAIQICAPGGIPDVRIAKLGAMSDYTTDKGLAMMKAVAGQFPGTQVTTGTVCNGTQPAVFAISTNGNGAVEKKMALVMGHIGGAIVTFENPSGAPVDPGIENMFDTLCWP